MLRVIVTEPMGLTVVRDEPDVVGHREDIPVCVFVLDCAAVYVDVTVRGGAFVVEEVIDDVILDEDVCVSLGLPLFVILTEGDVLEVFETDAERVDVTEVDLVLEDVIEREEVGLVEEERVNGAVRVPVAHASRDADTDAVEV